VHKLVLPRTRPSRFHQLHLEPAILEGGAFSQKDVTVPWEPVATLAWRPETFTDKLGIKFQESFDDLDDLLLAVLELWTGRQIALVEYPRSPNPDTIVQVTGETGTSTSDILKEVTDALGLMPSDVTWQRSE
jgi:hypothetical protein